VFIKDIGNLFEFLKISYPLTHKWIIGGDFNINLLSNEGCIADEFIDLLMSYCMYPTIFLPTRLSSHALLDNVFLSWPGMCDSFVISVDISDHLPIITRVTLEYDNNPLPYCKQRKINSVKGRADFKSSLEKCSWQSVYNTFDVNSAYNNFSVSFLSSYDNAFLLQPIINNPGKVYNNSWFTSGLLCSSRKRSQLYRDYSKGKITKQYYNKYRNIYTSLIRRAKIIFFHDLLNKNKNNIKIIWQHIRRLKQVDNMQLNTNANDLNDFFANLGPNTVKNVTGDGNYSEFVLRNANSFVLEQTSPDEVVKVCLSLKAKASCGIDGVSTKLLQHVINEIAGPLSHIFNLSFLYGIFPASLKVARVVPIFKGGDPTKLINYRPVSILPSISKLLERLMYNRIMSFTNKYSLLTRSQYGFRAHKSK
jgi:hypothetical protein